MLFITALLFLAGASVGSFLQLAAMRTVAGGSVLRPRSHCDACETMLAPADLIPIASYISLKGRCRYCHTGIGRQSVLVELLTGMVFVLLLFRFGLTLQTAVFAVLASLLILMALIDQQTQDVFDAHLAAVGICALASLFFRDSAILHSVPGLLFWIVLSRLLAHRMGDGDKFLITILLLSLPPLLQIRFFLYSIWSAAIMAIYLLRKGANGKTAIPFVPFLGIGYVLTLLIHGGSL